MFKSCIRFVAVIVASTTLLFGSEGQACWLTDWFTHKPEVCAAPVAPTYNVCPQQVSYVPQTTYTTQYQCVPCTTYRPISSCNPCGGAQTAMQPVTTYVSRPVMVPVTTYRPVVTRLNYAAPACSTCGAAPYYTPTTSANYPAAMVAAPSAAAGYAPAAVAYGAAQANYATPMYSTTTTAPAIGNSIMVAPGISGPVMNGPLNYQGATNPNYSGMIPPSMTYQQGTPTPAIPNNGVAPQSTFQPNTSGVPSSSGMAPLAPIPDNDKDKSNSDSSKTNSSMSAPHNGDSQGRTTSTGPLMGPAIVTTALFNTAERPFVFHPATMNIGRTASSDSAASNNSDGWAAANSAIPAATNDGWQSAGSR